MSSRCLMFAFFICLFVIIASGSISTSDVVPARGPRCIVVQKQSGSKDNDDEEEDYRGPTPKGPRTNKLTAHANSESEETEDLDHGFQRFKVPPAKWFNNKILNKLIGI